MPIVERITRERWPSAPWGAAQGVTHELARWDDDDGGYLARVSVAEVARSGPFSRVPGYRRCSVVLDDGGGLTLSVDGAPRALAPGEVARYDGGAATEATVSGPARLWNLIARADVPWTATAVERSTAAVWQAGVLIVTARVAGRVELDGAELWLAPEETVVATSSLPLRARVDVPAVVAHLAVAPSVRPGATALAPASQLVVELAGAAMTTVDAFHDELARGLGLPAFYGRNLDALIDCLTSLDEPDDGLSTIHAPPGGLVVLVIADAARLPPELATALSDVVAFVNHRRRERGRAAVVALSADLG